jgi:4-hydroxybenzoate polyprenyltransferase
LKPEFNKNLLMLAVNTVILMVIYFYIPQQFEFPYIPHIYLAVGGILAITYIAYNRGITKRLTPDMLSDEIPFEQRERFAQESNSRLERSKWMLTLLIPILVVFAVDMVYLFVVPLFSGWFQ